MLLAQTVLRKKTIFSRLFVYRKCNSKFLTYKLCCQQNIFLRNKQLLNLFQNKFLLNKLVYCISRKMAKSELEGKKECYSVKPPNILIYTNEGKFEEVKNCLLSLLKNEQYVIYHLSEKLLKLSPWLDNTQLLVIDHSDVNEEVAEIIKKYMGKGGNVLGFATDFIKNFVKLEGSELTSTQLLTCDSNDDLLEIQLGKLSLSSDSQEKKQCDEPLPILAKNSSNSYPVFVKMKGEGLGTIIFSMIPFEKFSLLHDKETVTQIFRNILSTHFGFDCTSSPLPKLTPGYLFGNAKDKAALQKCLELKHNRLVSRGITLTFTQPDATDSQEVSETHLPVFIDCCLPEERFFRPEVYFSSLSTRTIGRLILYVDIIPTTLTITEILISYLNTVVIAGRQTQGRGRGGNAWLSPRGCALFSFPFQCSLSSHLGKRPSFIQHLMALAFVESIRTKPGYEDLDIHVKWPNDVYFERRIKIGGLIVTSTINQSQLCCSIGMGLNVSNVHPTACVWSAIEKLNRDKGIALPMLSVEEVIASTLTTFEQLVETYQKDGPQSSIDTYMKRWLHSDCEVTLRDEGRGHITGIDEYGFLMVRLGNKVVSVQPDGNTFDLMHNLITIKHR